MLLCFRHEADLDKDPPCVYVLCIAIVVMLPIGVVLGIVIVVETSLLLWFLLYVFGIVLFTWSFCWRC